MFDNLDPRLSLLCDVICPCKKICGGCQMCVPRSIHPWQRCPIQSRLKSVLGVHSSYIERNNHKSFITLFAQGKSLGWPAPFPSSIFHWTPITCISLLFFCFFFCLGALSCCSFFYKSSQPIMRDVANSAGPNHSLGMGDCLCPMPLA